MNIALFFEHTTDNAFYGIVDKTDFSSFLFVLCQNIIVASFMSYW